jgi:hypothetical protein
LNGACWIDSWAPGIHRPVSKLETTMRLAAMLNEVEKFMIHVLREGVTRTGINMDLVDDPKLKEAITGCTSVEKLQKLIPVNGSVTDLLSRLPAIELPQVCVYLRAMLKEEINASTGVQDMQRGQALGGERRTKEEVVRFMDASGVQARHLRASFARFLTWAVHVTRVIAAQFDTAETTLHLSTYGPVKTSEVPVSQMLSMDLPVQVNPYSLVFKTEEERRQEAANEFVALHQPYIALGAIDPVKSMVTTMKKFGYKDPLAELGFSPQQQAEMAAAAAGAGEGPEGPERT